MHLFAGVYECTALTMGVRSLPWLNLVNYILHTVCGYRSLTTCYSVWLLVAYSVWLSVTFVLWLNLVNYKLQCVAIVSY